MRSGPGSLRSVFGSSDSPRGLLFTSSDSSNSSISSSSPIACDRPSSAVVRLGPGSYRGRLRSGLPGDGPAAASAFTGRCKSLGTAALLCARGEVADGDGPNALARRSVLIIPATKAGVAAKKHVRAYQGRGRCTEPRVGKTRRLTLLRTQVCEQLDWMSPRMLGINSCAYAIRRWDPRRSGVGLRA